MGGKRVWEVEAGPLPYSFGSWFHPSGAEPEPVRSRLEAEK
jgi:hypothetical protein